MNYNFKVSTPRGEKIALPLVYLSLLGILTYFTLPSGRTLVFVLGAVLLSGLFLLTLLTTCLFSVTVSGAKIQVRAHGGKKHSFTCRDIDHVVCTKKSSVKHGPLFYITIVTGKHEFSMEGKMAGFSNMAKYLLEMSAQGELKPTAVSESCKSKLQHYQNGVTSVKNMTDCGE